MPSRPRAPNGGRPAVSIQDVADAAGVSIATVSRVLNSPKLVAPETAARVRATVERMGYTPNAFAQGLITRASRVLGVALPDIHGEFYSELLRGADAEAKRLGYHLLVTSGQGTTVEQDAGLNPALGFIDGLALMITEPDAALLRRVAASRLPVVVMDAAPGGPAIDSVSVDNEAGAREATEHLLTLVSPPQCYFVGGPRTNFDTMCRAGAFEVAIAGRGHRMRPDQVLYGTYSLEWGRSWAEGMIASGRMAAGAGVLAGNDEVALGIMQAAQEAGLTVPGQVVIVGFDDTRLASLVRPTLSTVRVPLVEVGARAIGCLVRRIREPEAAPMRVRLTPTLVVRESTGGLVPRSSADAKRRGRRG